MKYEIYSELKMSEDLSVVEFVSIGKNIPVKKRIAFIRSETSDIINLVFGDIRADGTIDYYSLSDNGDRNKILATIAFVTEQYLNRYPDRWIHFSGSTDGRTRLYRMAISNNLDELKLKFNIYADQIYAIVPFEKNIYLTGIYVTKKVL